VTRQFECDEPMILDMTCCVHQAVPGLYGYLSISRMDGTTVMVSDSFDAGENTLDQLSEGVHSLRIAVPARTLGPGEYAVYLNFASPSGMRDFHIDSPGTLCTFRLDDNATRRGNQRQGYFSTVLRWDIATQGETGAPSEGASGWRVLSVDAHSEPSLHKGGAAEKDCS
jgi:hypothetical protein